MTTQPPPSSLAAADDTPALGDARPAPDGAPAYLCIFTIVASNYLSLAYTLADTVRLHQPEADLRIFVADGTRGLLQPLPVHSTASIYE